MDSNQKIVRFWQKKGEQTTYSDIKMDGFADCLLNASHVLKFQQQDLKNKLSKHLDKNKKQLILDYGCGTGRYLYFLLKNKKYRFIGIDLSRSILDNFTNKKFMKNKRVKLLATDLSKNKFLAQKYNNSFNAIYTISVIQYIKYKQLPKLIENFFILLKPGGVVYLQFPNTNDKWDQFLTLNYLRYYPITLKNYLIRAGFEILDDYSVYHQQKFEKLDSKKLKNYGYTILAKKPVLT